MRRFVYCLLFSLTAAAQDRPAANPPAPAPPGAQTPRATAPSAPEDLCTLHGQVFNVTTGEPVKKANLNLQRVDLTPDIMSMPVSYSTTTDGTGKYAMKDIEAGKYRLSVNRNGYVNATYGARGPNRPGTTLSLTRGQNLKDVSFRLIPHAVITGRILDEDGDPVPNVRVQIMTNPQSELRAAYSIGTWPPA